MYDPKSKVYYYCEDTFPNEHKYRFEATYYIQYYSQKAIYAFDMIEEGLKQDQTDCFYYHVYKDLLFEACGSLAHRFNMKPKDEENLDEREQQVRNNRYEYSYTSENYPILSSAWLFRNFIEHLDERSDEIIKEDYFQGTFNVVFPFMDDEKKDEYTENIKLNVNLLDLSAMEYRVFCRNKTDGEVKDTIKTIDLNGLVGEVKRINEIASRIWEYLNNPF